MNLARPDFEAKEALKARTEPRKNLATAEDLNELLAGVQYLFDSLGWENYADGQYTAANKRTLAAGVPAQITIDGAVVINTHAPVIPTHLPFWSNNLIQSTQIGATYEARLNFVASTTSNDGYISYAVFIGPLYDIRINSGQLLFPKGINQEHDFTIKLKLFSLDTFLPSGAKIVFTPSHTSSIWNQLIFIEKGFNGR
jgi:hypothetical protein